MLWVNRRGNDFIYTPVNEGEKLNLNNHDNTAVILELPLSRDSAWDSMMFVHHQMWLKSNCEETTVVQKWLRFWGWLPRSFGDHFFASFMCSLAYYLTPRRRGSCSITMIPGPKEPIKFTGNPITSIVNLTSPIGNEEIHISVICYVNKIAVSITADDSICTQEDLAQILSLCNDNLQEIRKHIASWDLWCNIQKYNVFVNNNFTSLSTSDGGCSKNCFLWWRENGSGSYAFHILRYSLTIFFTSSRIIAFTSAWGRS